MYDSLSKNERDFITAFERAVKNIKLAKATASVIRMNQTERIPTGYWADMERSVELSMEALQRDFETIKSVMGI